MCRIDKFLSFLLVVLLNFSWSWVRAELSVSSLVNDHMVIQREKPIVISGHGYGGDRITVSLGRESQTVTARENGNWRVELASRSAGGPYFLKIETALKSLVFEDVYIGDVWLCAGQSNMNFLVRNATDRQVAKATASEHLIREFRVVPSEATTPVERLTEGRWVIASEDTVDDFSAVAWFFASAWQKENPDVPVGIVRAALGGSSIESWISREAQLADDTLRAVALRIDQQRKSFQEKLATYEESLLVFRQAEAEGRSEGENPGRRPSAPMGLKNDVASLYNGMIYPLRDYPVRGVIWYQGESNTGRPRVYEKQLVLLISEWRRLWGVEELPFFVVQLPRLGHPGAQSWPWVREAQARAVAQVSGACLSVIIDTGATTREVHPPDKKLVGERIARNVVRHLDQGKLSPEEPRYSHHEISGREVNIFLNVQNVPLRLSEKEAFNGFSIAGEDGEFHAAEVRLSQDGRGVIVSSSAVDEPRAVRYAWSNLATGLLRDSEGLPTAPFRTDDWPLNIERGLPLEQP